MARPLRIEFEGATYHVMSRGNNGGDIFFSDEGRELFIDTLDEACTRAGWVIHAYVLMGNHYHLLLETPQANLVEGMKWLQGTYTQRINRLEKRRGHLFQGRYKAQLINSEHRSSDYFKTVAEYIHLNPARANMISSKGEWKQLIDYPWSSYPLYSKNIRKRPDWLNVTKVLESYQLEDLTKGIKAYKDYLESRVQDIAKGESLSEASYEQLRRGWCIGNKDFKELMLELAEELISTKKKGSLDKQVIKEYGVKRAAQLLEQGLTTLELHQSDLSKLPKLAKEKQVLASWISSQSLVSSEWLAQKLHMGHISNISNAKKWVMQNKEGQILVKKLTEQLGNQ